MSNFFSRPVGASVLKLNDFHNGKYLDALNRAARLCPKDVQGMATMVDMSPDVTADTVALVVGMLTKWADEAEAEA
jgi:hypothetical protein